MRAVSIEDIEPGALLGKSIWANDGRPLLRRGAELSAKSIATLARMGYQYIYIEDELGEGVEVNDLLSDETRAVAINSVRDAFTAMAGAKDPRFSRTGLNFQAISDVAGDLVEQILSNPDLIIQVVDLKSFDQYTFQHCVNVAVLGVVLGKGLGLNFSDLKDLTIGLLLHDLGNVTIPEAILNKPTKLTDEELKYVFEHPRSGYELLRRSERISGPSKIVALQHHERLDGSGYPKGLMGADMHIFSQVAAIVDAYDALTSDRHFRKRYLPHEAIEYLMGAGGTHFSFDLVKRFCAEVAPYPPGSIIKLSSGDSAVVMQIEKETMSRPTVRLLADANGTAYPKDELLELKKFPTVAIVQVIDSEADRPPPDNLSTMF